MTAKEYADRWEVDVKTVYRWIEKGAVPVQRTPSGRIRLADAPQPVLTTANLDNRGQP